MQLSMGFATAAGVMAFFGSGSPGHPPAAPVPAVFAPGVISGPADDAAPAFTPDGRTVYFMRGTDDGSTLMESHLDGRWSAPRTVSFSGHWRDLDPAMAPDGSFLLFVSNRPAEAGGQPVDATGTGKRRPGLGMNIWRVDRQQNGWGTPVRLPDAVNACGMTFAPSVAADGSIYFIGCAPPDIGLHLLRSLYREGRYQTPSPVSLGDVGAQIRDPAIAPDGSYIVFSIKHDPAQPYRLAIAFHGRDGWSKPLDLGDAVNSGTHSMGAQWGCDRRTLYFYSDRRLPSSDPDGAATWNNGGDNIWRVSLTPWLEAHGAGTSVVCTTG
ncbi:WD40 repeat protein [Luteibacter rhizovicinus]|uniref:WD40 repeat protein n=1 Tax=Luteibacter rhizovicinus TaxID=242606 RepID=A0A4R3YQP2_9GAMM|nr:PD40 domain-containing protein [Luteibacter rhizovicinus]TCV94686.1 WD40 repeat protein [Luteibacter rhizovicinus]